LKIKLDENIPTDAAEDLQRLGHDVHTVFDEGLSAADDGRVWEVAQREQRLLITQDVGFEDPQAHSPGAHSGVIFLRLDNASRRALTARIVELFTAEDVQSWGGCVIVARQSTIRVRART